LDTPTGWNFQLPDVFTPARFNKHFPELATASVQTAQEGSKRIPAAEVVDNLAEVFECANTKATADSIAQLHAQVTGD